MWKFPLLNTPYKELNIATVQNVDKPELFRYYRAILFRPTNTSLLRAIKKGFLKSWPGLSGFMIKTNLYKSINTTLVHLHMKIQGVLSTQKKALDADLSDNRKTNIVFCVPVDQSDYDEGNIYSGLCGCFPTISNKLNRYIYMLCMYIIKMQS